MSTTTLGTPVTALSAAMLDVSPLQIDWTKAGGEYGEGFDYAQSVEHEHDGVTYTLVVNRSSVAAVFTPEGTRVDAYEWQDYADTFEDGEPTMSEETFDALCAVEPYDLGAEGPMMSYLYPMPEMSTDSIGRYNHTVDMIGAAYALRGVSLCVVEVDETVGLALTGGGMDMTWDIVGAFCALGFLPPVHFCDAPGFGDAAQEYLTRAMFRAVTFKAEQLRNRVDRLASQFPHLQNG